MSEKDSGTHVMVLGMLSVILEVDDDDDVLVSQGRLISGTSVENGGDSASLQ